MPAEETRPRVLVLDDEPLARDILRRFLRKYGYEAVETSSAEEAVDALRRGGLDAVILDVRLPGKLTGLDVLRRFRRETPESHAPVIILTGGPLSDDEESEVTRSRGFLFRKPESMDGLMQFIDQLLGRDQPQ